MSTVHVNGIDLYYEEHGEGEPLLLIMGWGGNAATWKPQLPGLAERFRVIAFDNRGVGRSSAPEAPYSIAQMAEDTLGLLDALDVPRAHVFGISMGGMVAQELALRHPAHVRALILGCTTGGAGGVGPSAATLEKMIRNQALSGDEALAAGWQLGYSPAYIERHYDALLQRSRTASSFAAPRESYLRQIVAAAHHDAYGRLAAIACPVMIIHGADDVMIPAENARMMKLAIAHAEMHILDGMGHGYNLEAQELADELVIDFVRRHGRVDERSASAAR
jgi:pimeloyl-ACP methyl ester carboxylesterase